VSKVKESRLYQFFLEILQHFWWYAGVVAVLRVLEGFYPAGPAPSWGDMAFNFTLAYIAAVIATTIAHAAPLAVLTVDWLGVRDLVLRGWKPQSAAEWVAGSLVFAFVWDLAQYWFHRLQHTFPSLWFMHALHHDTEALNATDALRNTLWHSLAGGLFIGIPLFIVGAHNLLHVYASYLLFSTIGFYNHANIRWSHGPLTAVFSGPQLHRLHHGLDRRYYNQNYAAFFPVIDIMFGTYRPPNKDEFPTTGLVDQPQSRGGPLAICAALLSARGKWNIPRWWARPRSAYPNADVLPVTASPALSERHQ
jgi:sterol desaturase/sphingolipid hydroxylase (fatty acid hydroxylase superfamily)